MSKLILIPIFLLSIVTVTYSQKYTQDFEISMPRQKVQNSFYKTIKYIDSRDDTTNMGIVLLDHGFNDSRTTVISKTPFTIQLTGFLNSITDSTAKNGELLFQMRKFNFMQTSQAMWSKRYCFIRAEIYSEKNGVYYKIAFIDTVIITTGAVNRATKKSLKAADFTISDFITNSLVKENSDSDYYSLNDILKIDSTEKLKMFVYNTATYSDGLYTTYKSFINQTPDKQITVKMNGDEVSSVTTLNNYGKPANVKTTDIYAIVYHGLPFIATKYGFFKLQKVDGDFIFFSKGKATADNGDVAAASFAFGIIGGLIASNVTGTFEIKIDHIDGSFIILKQIIDTTE